MNEVKRAVIDAFNEVGNALLGMAAFQELPEDPRAAWKTLMDPNYNAKAALLHHAESLLDRAKKLERSDVKKGDWPPFQITDAQTVMDRVERIESDARDNSKDIAYVAAVVKALDPLRAVLSRYAEETQDGWRFPEGSEDTIENPQPPPAPDEYLSN